MRELTKDNLGTKQFLALKVIALVVLPSSLMAGPLEEPPEISLNGFNIDAGAMSDCIHNAFALPQVEGRTFALEACPGKAQADCYGDRIDRVALMTCVGLETEYWEWRMDVVVDLLSNADTNFFTTEAGNLSEPLLASTVASWQKFRDVKCEYQTAHYGQGASRGREGDIVEMYCRAFETARFASDLEGRLRARCDIPLGSYVNYNCGAFE